MRCRPIVAVAVLTLWTTSYAQQAPSRDQTPWSPQTAGGPFTGPPVPHAPFSADATTTVNMTLEDGRYVNTSHTARYYRDGEGRVRVEQVAIGLDGSSAPTKERMITVHPDPEDPWVYRLNPATRVAFYGPRWLADQTVGGDSRLTLPLGRGRFLVFQTLDGLTPPGRQAVDADVQVEPLGHRQVEGLRVVGYRTQLRVQRLVRGQPLAIINDTWESPELQLLIYARHATAAGHVEYRLSNISRTEPTPDLFVVPPDYELKNTTRDEPWISTDTGRSRRPR